MVVSPPEVPALIVVGCCAALAAQKKASARVSDQRCLDLMTVPSVLVLTQKTSSSCGNTHSSEIFCEPIAQKRTNYRPTWNERHRFAIPHCRATVYFRACRELPIPNHQLQRIRSRYRPRQT